MEFFCPCCTSSGIWLVYFHTSNLFAERVIVVLNLIATTNGFTIFYLFYIPFGITLELLTREWKNGTVGWWLSLPYSRKLLLAAKSMAGFFRFIKLLLIFVIATAFLTILTINLHPDVGNIALLHDLPQRILYSSAIAILLSPFFLISGTLAVLGKSQMKVLPVLLRASILAVIGSIFLISPLRTSFPQIPIALPLGYLCFLSLAFQLVLVLSSFSLLPMSWSTR